MTSPGAHYPAWQQAGLRHYLHTLRKQFGMSVGQLSKEIGYGPNVINAWERGYTAPTFVQLTEWASVFQLRVLLTPVITTKHPSSADQLKRRAVCAEIMALDTVDN